MILALGALVASAQSDFSLVDLGGGVHLARPTSGFARERPGLVGEGDLPDRILAATVPDGDPAPPEMVVVMFTGGVEPRETALAFHSQVNLSEEDVAGRGQQPRGDGTSPVGSLIYMNQPGVWSVDEPDLVDQIFVHEVGHRWLAYADVGGPVSILGRMEAHWSYFMATDTSPMDGNTWIDNGDGTFTSDPEGGFNDFIGLELYLMGLVGPEEVEPWWVIDPAPEVKLSAELRPDNRRDAESVTIPGTRVDFDIDAVIGRNGLVTPQEDRVHELRLVLIAGAFEVVNPAEVERTRELMAQWTRAWSSKTGGRSEVVFESAADFALPPPPSVPAFVPRDAR